MARFLLGVNYWPRSGPGSLWSRFDLGEIDDDFAHVATLGFEAVRFFLPWATFAPSAGTMSQAALDGFEILLDRLDAHRLRALPALFCGHACCAEVLPAWARDPAGGGVAGDFYRGDLLEAQRTFARAVLDRLQHRGALGAFLDEHDYYAGLPGSLARAYTAYLEENDLTEEIS